MRVPILMPQLGESIAEATIKALNIQTGESVAADQEIIEVETEKAVMGVTAPCRGCVAELTAKMNISYPVGTILGYLEIDEIEATRLGMLPVETDTGSPPKTGTIRSDQSDASLEKTSALQSTSDDPDNPEVTPTIRGLPVPASAKGATYISPRLRARMQELGLNAADLAGIAGSGAAGRVTVEDFEAFMSALAEKKTTAASPMRIAVADSMRRSWTRPLATVGTPVSLDKLLNHRNSCNPKPGPTLYTVRALAIALSENTAAAGQLVGNQIVHPDAIDIGFAVEVDDGVLVPVIRNVDKKPLNDLTQQYASLVQAANKRRLPNEASTPPGIATVTNFGSFGIVWATPIPLPEQNIVLGLGYGRHQPQWDSESSSWIPVVEAEMTLSFDHRILDGGAAGRLLWRVAELLQSPENL
jgi:pyruvate/2-oxoglutarate dehydrogenase complex dihydrolipoamide acyltransferase (E2) component